MSKPTGTIELPLGPRTIKFRCERVEQGVAINPVLPESFDHTANESRPTRHLAWWDVPYIVTYESEDPEWCKAWPGGVRYDLRCLNGGSWDRSTWCGSFATLEEALGQVDAAKKDYGQAARERSFALQAQRAGGAQ